MYPLPPPAVPSGLLVTIFQVWCDRFHHLDSVHHPPHVHVPFEISPLHRLRQDVIESGLPQYVRLHGCDQLLLYLWSDSGFRHCQVAV